MSSATSEQDDTTPSSEATEICSADNNSAGDITHAQDDTTPSSEAETSAQDVTKSEIATKTQETEEGEEKESNKQQEKEFDQKSSSGGGGGGGEEEITSATLEQEEEPKKEEKETETVKPEEEVVRTPSPSPDNSPLKEPPPQLRQRSKKMLSPEEKQKRKAMRRSMKMKMEEARNFGGDEMELPFKKPNQVQLLLQLAAESKNCLVPLINVLSMTAFDESSYEAASTQADKLVHLFVCFSPLIFVIIAVMVGIEQTCRRYLYYRLMEHGYLLDFQNYLLWESYLFWLTILQSSFMLYFAPAYKTQILVSTISLMFQWNNILNFEKTLVSLSRFVESKDGVFSQESFDEAGFFLRALQYISEDNLRYYAAMPINQTADQNGKYDIGSLAGELPATSTSKKKFLLPTKESFFAYRYISKRRGKYVDDCDNTFSFLIATVVKLAAAVSFSLVLFVGFNVWTSLGAVVETI